MPLLPGPQSIAAGSDAKALPVTRASEGGIGFMAWRADGSRLDWTLGPLLFGAALTDMMPSAPPTTDVGTANRFDPPTSGVSLAVTVKAARPDSTVAISGARVVTMSGDDGGIIEDAVILLEGPRISAIGPKGTISIPSGATRVDATGKTILPGFIDAHAHGPFGDDDIVPQQNWSLIAHLALGVTTIHNPSTVSSEAFEAAELQRAGRLLAPRSFSTGEIVYGAKSPGLYAEITSYDDALAHVRRLKAQGAHSIKNYNQPRREQRQQVVAAAIAEGMEVVAEGGSLFSQDITIIADGNTSLEHNIPQRVLYEDVVSFFSQTKVAYTPTLVVSFGGLGADPYWRQATDVWTHPILSHHVPPHVLQPKSVRRVKAPEEDFEEQYIAREARKLSARGVTVNTGAHGQEEGLGTHWELWSFVRGGWTPLEALRAATINPARHLGMDADIGSLEKGKLADLLILDANPLEDIRNSDKLSGVMLNGRLYDPVTMNEVTTGNAVRAPYYWER
jgi:imidazolonepropionase-like amidohydrolase